MNKPWEVVQKLESDNSRIFKEGIIDLELVAKNDEFFTGVKYCLDSLLTFGVKKVPEATSNGPGLDWEVFEEVLENLISRESTGHYALNQIEQLKNQATMDQWNNWYRRILIKDLRCGVSEKTINNVVEEHGNVYLDYKIPVFTCQLAKDQEDHQSYMKGEKIIDTKMDGSRVLSVLYPDGRVLQFSRNGKAIENFPVIIEQLKKYTSQIEIPMILDGEVMSSSFQDLMKQMHRKTDVQTDDAVLQLFDIIPLAQFLEGYCNQGQKFRRITLDSFIAAVPKEEHPNINTIDYEIVNLGTEEGQIRFREINDFAIEKGFEGIMIKDPVAPYECKRSVNWLKMKPFITVDLIVVDMEEGTGKNKGRLGALVCDGVDNGKHIKVNVGTGISENQRTLWWEHKNNMIGQTVEIKADVITKAQDSDEYSLRFPRFVCFRDDKE